MFYTNMSLKNHISVKHWSAKLFTYDVNTITVRLNKDLLSKNKQFTVCKTLYSVASMQNQYE